MNPEGEKTLLQPQSVNNEKVFSYNETGLPGVYIVTVNGESHPKPPKICGKPRREGVEPRQNRAKQRHRPLSRHKPHHHLLTRKRGRRCAHGRGQNDAMGNPSFSSPSAFFLQNRLYRESSETLKIRFLSELVSIRRKMVIEILCGVVV